MSVFIVASIHTATAEDVGSEHESRSTGEDIPVDDPINAIPTVAAQVSSDLIHMIHRLYVMFKPKENEATGSPQQQATDSSYEDSVDKAKTTVDVTSSHDINSLADLVSATSEIGNWEGLCVNLHVNAGILTQLRYSQEPVDIKKIRCLETYFNSGEANWKELIRAVSSFPIVNIKVARQIATKYGINYINNDEL